MIRFVSVLALGSMLMFGCGTDQSSSLNTDNQENDGAQSVLTPPAPTAETPAPTEIKDTQYVKFFTVGEDNALVPANLDTATRAQVTYTVKTRGRDACGCPTCEEKTCTVNFYRCPVCKPCKSGNCEDACKVAKWFNKANDQCSGPLRRNFAAGRLRATTNPNNVEAFKVYLGQIEDGRRLAGSLNISRVLRSGQVCDNAEILDLAFGGFQKTNGTLAASSNVKQGLKACGWNISK